MCTAFMSYLERNDLMVVCPIFVEYVTSMQKACLNFICKTSKLQGTVSTDMKVLFVLRWRFLYHHDDWYNKIQRPA